MTPRNLFGNFVWYALAVIVLGLMLISVLYGGYHD